MLLVIYRFHNLVFCFLVLLGDCLGFCEFSFWFIKLYDYCSLGDIFGLAIFGLANLLGKRNILRFDGFCRLCNGNWILTWDNKIIKQAQLPRSTTSNNAPKTYYANSKCFKWKSWRIKKIANYNINKFLLERWQYHTVLHCTYTPVCIHLFGI